MKKKNKCIRFPKISWVKELESDLEYKRYRNIIDYEDNLSIMIPKIQSNKAFLFIRHDRKKQILYEKSNSLAIIRKNRHQTNEEDSSASNFSMFNQNISSEKDSFINKFREKQMEQLDSKDFEYNYEDYSNNNQKEQEECVSLTNLHQEYDQYIINLKQQYQLSKELRKKSDVDAKAMQHRIALLKNQEKYALMQFQNTKKKIEQILNNRTLAEINIKYNINNCSNVAKETAKKKIRNYRTLSGEQRPKPLSSGYSTKEITNSNSRKNSVKNERIIPFDQQQKMKQKVVEIYHSDNVQEKELEIKKQKMKEELLNKLRQEEEERLRIENEIAIIEKEEMKILQMFSVRKDLN